MRDDAIGWTEDDAGRPERRCDSLTLALRGGVWCALPPGMWWFEIPGAKSLEEAQERASAECPPDEYHIKTYAAQRLVDAARSLYHEAEILDWESWSRPRGAELVDAYIAEIQEARALLTSAEK